MQSERALNSQNFKTIGASLQPEKIVSCSFLNALLEQVRHSNRVTYPARQFLREGPRVLKTMWSMLILESQPCSLRWNFVLMALIGILVGCQNQPTKLVPVHGVVLMHGMPARANITAQAVNEAGQPSGRPSTCDTRPDGSFSLLYGEGQAGALIGQQQVTISVYPHERAEGEFDFNQRFRPVKVARFRRQVEAGKSHSWKFFLTL